MVDMALYVAAEYGYADLVKEMIKFHDVAMAVTKSRNGYDAFHIAAKQGNLATVAAMAAFSGGFSSFEDNGRNSSGDGTLQR
ncbi:hypothetical protein LWI29_004439 [Acer saccharum]|uniref:Uncharacterized protein n=1 Tax=Acer saccharum TaxID=4024 RepID=A0AA39RK78_ACESA|nr:hypothetical protein LWI29_004439 [Acer saccharum]